MGLKLNSRGGLARLGGFCLACVLCVQTPVFGGAVASVDEMEADWIAQGGAAPTNMAHEAWRAEMLKRRAARLAPVAAFAKKWVYCRHYVMGGSHYAYMNC